MDTMTPRERWQAVMRRETPDRLPMDIWATDEARTKLLKHLGCDYWEMLEKLHIDAVVTVGPTYVGPPIPDDEDMYGCTFQMIEHGGGIYREIASHPLAQYNTVEEIDAHYTWPTVEWFDYSGIPAHVNDPVKSKYPLRGGGSEPFLKYCHLRGLEQAYMDLAMNPDMVDYCLDKLFDFAYEDTSRIYEQADGRIMFSYVAEDLGSQESLLFSPKTIRRFFLPRMKRMMDLAHSADVYVFHHTDGAVRPIIPDLIGIGIDLLNPIQWRCKGMERDRLQADFGDQVIFHGGVDNQQTLVYGSPDDVRQEVQENIATLGKDGGYIIGPCHNIQVVSPVENILAMYEEGYRSGRR